MKIRLENLKPRNYVAKDLFTNDLYGMKVEKTKKAYKRREKHKVRYDKDYEKD